MRSTTNLPAFPSPSSKSTAQRFLRRSSNRSFLDMKKALLPELSRKDWEDLNRRIRERFYLMRFLRSLLDCKPSFSVLFKNKSLNVSEESGPLRSMYG